MQQIRFTNRGSRALAAVVSIATLAACSDGGGNAAPSEPFGGFAPSDAELATYPKALPAAAYTYARADSAGIAATPASYVIPVSTLPPVQA